MVHIMCLLFLLLSAHHSTRHCCPTCTPSPHTFAPPPPARRSGAPAPFSSVHASSPTAQKHSSSPVAGGPTSPPPTCHLHAHQPAYTILVGNASNLPTYHSLQERLPESPPTAARTGKPTNLNPKSPTQSQFLV